MDLPVVAGLRRGFRRYHLNWQGSENVVALRTALLEEQLTVQNGSLALLALGGAGGLASVLWPLVPGLLTFVPLGLVLAVGAWLVVVARLRSSGLDEFLDAFESWSSGNQSNTADVVG